MYRKMSKFAHVCVDFSPVSTLKSWSAGVQRQDGYDWLPPEVDSSPWADGTWMGCDHPRIHRSWLVRGIIPKWPEISDVFELS